MLFFNRNKNTWPQVLIYADHVMCSMGRVYKMDRMGWDWSGDGGRYTPQSCDLMKQEVMQIQCWPRLIPSALCLVLSSLLSLCVPTLYPSLFPFSIHEAFLLHVEIHTTLPRPLGLPLLHECQANNDFFFQVPQALLIWGAFVSWHI